MDRIHVELLAAIVGGKLAESPIALVCENVKVVDAALKFLRHLQLDERGPTPGRRRT